MLSFLGINSNNNESNNESNNEVGESGEVVNYMGGTSYQPINPLMRLKMVAASYIRGEAKQYYRSSGDIKRDLHNLRKAPENISNYLLFPEDNGKNSVDIFDECLQNALDYDLEGTMRLAVELRRDYFMRKNPQCIMMAAAHHSSRADYNKNNPKVFKTCLGGVIGRPDDMTQQLDYWVGRFGSKSRLPTCVKKVWANELETMKKYQLQKYKRFIPDLVRISHARSKMNVDLENIVREGKTEVSGSQQTWEVLRSGGMGWVDILDELEWKMPHMAALRNIIAFAREVRDTKLIGKYGDMLQGGVLGGKQYPYRYLTAYRLAEKNENKDGECMRGEDQKQVMNIVERCLQTSVENFPKLEGDTLSLSDNSGSAHGSFTSTYGSVKVADIANLSGLLTAYNTEGRGVVGVFGDRLELYEVNKEKGILEQWKEINQLGRTVGGSTENGIWIAFKKSFEERGGGDMRFDNIFIYSDMQAGHGGLFGCTPAEYKEFEYEGHDRYIDVLKLVERYRRTVNSEVNVFSVQVAGYDNNLLPENIYRGAIMSGWTGNEVAYAKEMINIWDSLAVH